MIKRRYSWLVGHLDHLLVGWTTMVQIHEMPGYKPPISAMPKAWEVYFRSPAGASGRMLFTLGAFLFFSFLCLVFFPRVAIFLFSDFLPHACLTSRCGPLRPKVSPGLSSGMWLKIKTLGGVEYLTKASLFLAILC